MALLKQSTAYPRVFLLVQSADHISGLSGASPSISLSKAGGAFASAGGTVTEIGNGFYKVALTTTDTNTLGDLAFHITATSGDPTDFTDQVVAFDTQDAAALGLSRIDAAISSRMASFTLPANFAALGISPGGHISNVDTLTTYTGDTPQSGDSFARIGAAGTGLTALGDTRIAHLDADVSTRATPAQILTTALAESYAGLHSVPTLSQIVFEIRGLLAEKAVASTTLTVKKIDGATAAATFTLNDATAPTSITRTS